jgi:hypothetical protein
MVGIPGSNADPETSRGVVIRRRFAWLVAGGGRIRRFLRRALLIGGTAFIVLVVFFFTIYRPWQRTWGATDAEILRPMPGDEIVPEPTFDATRAVTINASPGEIWPWIVQIGYRRAGFYSYDWLDNDGVPSAERIIPEYQNLAVGDKIPLPIEAEVRVLEPNRFMLLVIGGDSHTHPPWTWAWGLYPQGAKQTRLVTRLRIQLDLLPGLFVDMFEIAMMRKCMLGIKQRVEDHASYLLMEEQRLAAPPEPPATGPAGS